MNQYPETAYIYTQNTSMSGKVIRAQGAAQRNDVGVCEENIREEESQR